MSRSCPSSHSRSRLRLRSLLVNWLPLCLWMTVIYSASSDSDSFNRSSRIIAPLVQWLFPHISKDSLDLVVLLARKGAHLTEYAVFAWLICRAIRPPGPWRWKSAGLAVLVVAAYAASDEFHQRFVPGRQSSVWDVVLDTIGGALGVLLAWAVLRWRNRGRGPRAASPEETPASAQLQ